MKVTFNTMIYPDYVKLSFIKPCGSANKASEEANMKGTCAFAEYVNIDA